MKRDLADEQAADADVELLNQMEVPVVVTATRSEEKVSTLPYAVSIITADDIRQSGARSIPDALRLVPGMDVADLSYSNYAVGPRGFQGLVNRQAVVLVDGRQLYDSLFGGTLWGSWPFQLEDIKRIEVIRGPGGVTWGANAVNGVINIITKDPAEQTGLTTTARGGSRGMQQEHLGYAFQDGPLRMRASGEYEGSDGYNHGGSWLGSLDDYYQAGRAAVHGIYNAGPSGTLTFSGGSALVNGGYPPTPLAGIGLRSSPESQASYLMGKWEHQVADDNEVWLTGYVNDFQLCPGIPQIDYRYQQLALQLGQTFKPSSAHRVTWGIDGRGDILDAGNADPFMLSRGFVSTGIIGLYVQDEWQFAPRWKLDLGGRVDYEFYGGFQPSARAALLYEVSDRAAVYAAVSRAFQMSPPGLRFLDIPLANGLARATGERDVDAESLVAYELGYRAKPLDRLATDVNVFWHEYADLTTLSPMLGPPGLVRFDLDNRAAASMYGTELDARYQLSRDLTLLGNYTFEELGWRSWASLHDKDSISPPEHKFMLGARYKVTRNLSLASHLYYVDAVKAPNPSNPFVGRSIDPYFRLDVRAEYEFWNHRASIAVGVRDLLDSEHYEGGTLFLNDAETPRTVFAEFRMHLP